MKYIAIAMVLILAACRDKTPPAPETDVPAAALPEKIIRTDARNAKIDVTLPLVANAVARCTPAKTRFAEGEPIALTLDLNEAPKGLNVGARLLDLEGEQLAYVLEPAEGKKSVIVTIDEKPKAGRYQLEGYWGGNFVCQQEVVVGES